MLIPDISLGASMRKTCTACIKMQEPTGKTDERVLREKGRHFCKGSPYVDFVEIE
jgi:hypothetical protein